LFGTRKVDSLSASAGLRAVREAIALRDPAIFCVHGITEGDALILATRFDRGYVYRGGEALFWNSSFMPGAIVDRYLPVSRVRPFERRGLLHVDGSIDGKPIALIATEFSEERGSRVHELRFVRTELRALEGAVLLFVSGLPSRSVGFGDLGFKKVAGERTRAIYSRMTA
jgi:hypothetical protein